MNQARRAGTKRLKIVQVISNVPNARPLPPTNQGGTEKIVYELTEELVRRGHEVYLFAAQGSRSSAKLFPYPAALNNRNLGAYVLKRLPPMVSIIHDHSFRSALSRRKLRVPTVSTLHLPVRHWVQNPVYVSKRAKLIMGKNRGDFVYNGINIQDYEFSKEKHGYLLFMGRLLREKGILHAMDIAEMTKKKLIIAGPIKAPELFRKHIAPRIQKNPNIQYVGAVGGKRKQQLLKHASCLLFPTLWEEPFGLVMIEAMACGTPVVALGNGAVPEILGRFPGMICQTVREMSRKVQQGGFPAPHVLRKYVISRFTTKRMTDDYLAIYGKIIRQHRSLRSKR
jgi:glycosyltransferase involved in cell wall biosynthesis